MYTWITSFFNMDLWNVLVSVADVLIVSFIIYRVLLLIRGTRATYTLIGLLVVGGLFLAANRLSMTTLRWLLDNLINYIILIIIIVFQADIRRGLMRVGRKMFFSARANEDVANIEVVVLSCAKMAENRIGALIVFERDQDLAEVVERGTLLEAKVSQALLINIFTPWPDNALHDGAVIIKEEQIREAATVLPLSRSRSLDKALGTRHRAGLGVTEETDALAIVVSEQRGTISLCAAGTLHMGLKPHDLRRELLARLTGEQPSGNTWLDRMMRALENRFGGNGSAVKKQRQKEKDDKVPADE